MVFKRFCDLEILAWKYRRGNKGLKWIGIATGGYTFIRNCLIKIVRETTEGRSRKVSFCEVNLEF